MRIEAHIHIGRKRKGYADCMSVRTLPKGKTVHWAHMLLSDATFSVQPAGLRRFRETGQKNVHAFVRGTTHADWDSVSGLPLREARYNPTKDSTFVDSEFGFPVHRAKFVMFDGARLLYYNE